jgi:uncharacterized protein DUF4388
MNQVPRRTLVRQLAESVWPGRAVNGYANLIAARLRKLADEKSTGVLPVSGHGDGAIFFSGGRVVYAESSHTPLAAHLSTGLAALGLADVSDLGAAAGGPGGLVPVRSVSSVTGALAPTEAVIDAVTELLMRESRYGKFRHSAEPPPGQVNPLAVESLLAEVQRRHAVLRQLAPVLTPDTAVTRKPTLDSPAAQVSSAQWGLLVRVGDGATPRGLALHLGRSVFGTTIEAYRLTELGLLAVTGTPALSPGAGGDANGTGRAGPAVSFLRALTGERGSDG